MGKRGKGKCIVCMSENTYNRLLATSIIIKSRSMACGRGSSDFPQVLRFDAKVVNESFLGRSTIICSLYIFLDFTSELHKNVIYINSRSIRYISGKEPETFSVELNEYKILYFTGESFFAVLLN